MSKILFKQKIFLALFGIVAALCLLEIGLRIGGAIFVFLQDQHNRSAIKAKGSYRILCLGESTTALGGKKSYPSQLEEILNQQQKSIKFSVINLGRPATTTEFILNHLEEDLNTYKPDMVVAMMGINDEIYEKFPSHNLMDDSHSWIKNFKIYKLMKLLVLDIKNSFNKENFSDNSNPILGLSWGYGAQGKAFTKTVKAKGKDIDLIVEGLTLRDKDRIEEAKEKFLEAIENNPKNEWAYLELGFCFVRQGHFPEAEEIFQTAVQINPFNDEAYFRLVVCYWGQKEYDLIPQVLEKVITLDPHRIDAYMEMARYYEFLKDPTGLIKIYQRAVEANPQVEWGYAGLIALYENQGQEELAKEYSQRLDKLRAHQDNPMTKHSYEKFKEILDRHKIKLVVVQYPTRSIQPLKRMLEGQEPVMFVDNEILFKEKVKAEGYKQYFSDRFAGDFGHCTILGNRLLAENIARAILKEFN